MRYLLILVCAFSLAAQSYNITWEGDSLTAGAGLSAGQSWASQFVSSVTSWTVTSNVNNAVTGKTIATMIANAATQLDTTTVAVPKRNVLFMLGGHNDIGSLAQDGAGTYALAKSFWNARSGVWMKVCFTIAKSDYLTGSLETSRLAYNTLIRADHSFCNVFVDYAADSRFLNTADRTYFQVDGIHYTAAGALVLAQLAWAAVQPANFQPPFSVLRGVSVAGGATVR